MTAAWASACASLIGVHTGVTSSPTGRLRGRSPGADSASSTSVSTTICGFWPSRVENASAMAANLARDEARTVLRRKKHLVLLKSEAESREGSGADPSSDLDEAERWADVRAALDSLSEKDREALLLWDAGQSYTEIARQLGLAVGAVGTTLARARRRLADAYNEREKANVARR